MAVICSLESFFSKLGILPLPFSMIVIILSLFI